MQIASGNYTGNGTSQSISGLGFQPDFIFIKGGSNNSCWVTSDMAADSTKPATGSTAPFAGGVTTIDADGFSVGSDGRVNTNTTVYDWIAIRDNGAGDFATGSYAGNGSDNRDISHGLGASPDMVLIGGTNAAATVFRTSDYSGDSSGTLNAGLTTNIIQAFAATTFQVGTDSRVNSSTGPPTYYWVAINNTANLFKALTYTGDGLDNRSITGVGFQPDNVWIKANSTQEGNLKMKRQTTDTAYRFSSGSAADRIQAFAADGFQVGTSIDVNASGVVKYSVSFKDGTSVLAGLPDGKAEMGVMPALSRY